MPLLKLPPIMTCHLTSAHTLESLQESRDGRLRNESAVLQTLLSALSNASSWNIKGAVKLALGSFDSGSSRFVVIKQVLPPFSEVPGTLFLPHRQVGTLFIVFPILYP